MAGKTKEQKALAALDARVRALEAHNGWTPGELHEEPDDTDTDTGKGKDEPDTDTDK
jgi:hypothetical protein